MPFAHRTFINSSELGTEAKHAADRGESEAEKSELAAGKALRASQRVKEISEKAEIGADLPHMRIFF